MWWVVAGVLLVVALWVVLTFNRLVGFRQRVREAWSGIDVQLRRRADLVPRLVEAVQGYLDHERELLEEVARARAALVAAEGPQRQGEADDALEAALGRLFAVVEGYPELRAADNVLALQRELAELEEDIAFARRYYNAVVQRLNTAIESFPTVLVARPLGFRAAEYFKAEAADRVAPRTGLQR